MRNLALAAVVLGAAGCSDPKGNPPVLWLQPLNGEQNVQLGGSEPHPY